MKHRYSETEYDEDIGLQTTVSVEGEVLAGSYEFTLQLVDGEVRHYSFQDTEELFNEGNWNGEYLVPTVEGPVRLDTLYDLAVSKIDLDASNYFSDIQDARILASPYMTGRV